jgi:hypothetical protein
MHMSSLHLRSLPLTLLAALAAAACSGDDVTNVSAPLTPDDGAPGGDEPAPPLAPPEPEPDPLYVGAMRVFNPEGSRGYLFATASLGADGEVDVSRAVEIDDAWVFGDGGPDFFTATLFEPTLTRWHVSPEGRFERGITLNFSNEGIGGTFAAASTPRISETKAYFVDSTSMQVVIWNPRDMELIGTIPLPDEGVSAELEPRADLIVRGDRAFVTVFWYSLDSGLIEYGDFVRLIAIDTETDRIIETTDDERCPTSSPSGTDADGNTYFSPWDYHTAVRGVFGAGYGSASCGLRVVPAGSSFDQSYELDLSTLVGGRPAGSMSLISDSEALLHVWHEELVDVTPETWQDKRFEPAYKWYRWQIGAPSAEELPDQAPSVEGSEFRVVDGKVLSFANNAEYSETTLIELDDEGYQHPGLVVPGWIVNMVRAY